MEWDSICYSSFNKITYIRSGDDVLMLAYGADKSRIMATTTKDNEFYIPKTKYYVGKYYEESENGFDIQKTCYIFAAGKAIAIFETTDAGATSIRYLHHDHLGSIQAYSNENGLLEQELSYDAWGRRRDPSTWDYDQINAWNPRGFGGHEHIDLFDMVNMDGRMYDPVMGRFLSPDPLMQASDFTQGLNRYSYCLNNPLSLIDPSGYSWFSRNWKSLVGAVVGITVAALTAGTATGPTVALIAGAAGGAAGALTCALLNGANIGQIAKSTLTGGLIGAASGFLNFGAGDGTFLESLFKHTLSGGWIEGVQGGNAFHGFMMGAVSGAGGHFINSKANKWTDIEKIAVNAALSGTVAEIGGGKFANGAITGAYSMMFNDMMHYANTYRRKIRNIYKSYREIIDNYPSSKSFYEDYLGGEIGEFAKASPEDYQNTCAARLSDALNQNDISIPSIKGQTYKDKRGNNVFIRAIDIRNYLIKLWGAPKLAYKTWRIRNAIVYQNGFAGGVSGHVDVFSRGYSGGAAYRYHNTDGIKTYYW